MVPPVTHPPVSQSPVDLLDDLVLQAFELVRRGVEGAVAAFLAGDRDWARLVATQDRDLDELHVRMQDEATKRLVWDRDLDEAGVRWLITVIRLGPELERSGDLAAHVADHGAQRLVQWLTPRAQDLMAQMGDVDVEMWRLAARAYAERDSSAAERLRRMDDEVDDLHVSLTSELSALSMSAPVAMQIGLVARFLERLGDHAVNVTQQLLHLEVPDGHTPT